MAVSRPFGSHDDLEKMKELVRTRGEFSDLQPGDLIWRYYRSADFSPTDDIRLWETEHGKLLAFAWYYPTDSFDMIVSEDVSPEEIESDILNWCQNRYMEFKDNNSSGLLWTGAVETDSKRISMLKSFDFELDESFFYHMVYYPEVDLVKSELPNGLTVRPIGDGAEIGEKVTAYREAFYPTDFSFEHYSRFRESPDYNKNLDLIMINDRGNIGSFAMGWYDRESMTGLIEPIGTRPGFKERGLERTLICDLVTRLLNMGARWVIAYPGCHEEDLIKAYSDSGFKMIVRNLNLFMRFLP